MISKEEFIDILNKSYSITQLFKMLGFSARGIHQRTINRYNKLFNVDIRKQIEENKLNKELNKPKEIHICKNCGKEFEEKYSKWSDGNFCCKKCALSYSTKEKRKEINEKVSKTLKDYYKTNNNINKGKKSSVIHQDIDKKVKIKKLNKRIYKQIFVDWECPYCGKIIQLKPYEAKRRKFCSGTCRNNYNNKFNNGQISKAEKLLNERLINEFKNLIINRNDRIVLNGLELDFYFPELNFAIEWNGIYHYKDVHKNGTLEKIIKKDNIKQQLCKEKNIDLYIVKDLNSNKKYIIEEINKIIEYIKNILNKRGEKESS